MSNEFGEQLADKVLDAAEKGTELRSGLTEELEDLRDTIEKIREKLSQRQAQRQNELDELKERLNEVMNRKIMGQRRILKAYPKLDSLPHRQALRRVRRWLNRSGLGWLDAGYLVWQEYTRFRAAPHCCKHQIEYSKIGQSIQLAPSIQYPQICPNTIACKLSHQQLHPPLQKVAAQYSQIKR